MQPNPSQTKEEDDEFITKIYSLPKCPVCGAKNRFSAVDNNDVVDNDKDVFTNDQFVCHECGSISFGEDLLWEKCECKISKHENYIRTRRNTYDREAHLNERIRQHCIKEPNISRHDMAIIRDFWSIDWKRTIICNSDFLEYAKSLRKENIQAFLRALDEKLNPTTGRRKPYQKAFCAKYLEKWKRLKKEFVSIELGNVEYKIQTWSPEEINRVVDVFLKFSMVWNILQPPQMKYKKKENWLFPDRKHFPNFNFMIRKCCEIIGLYFDPFDWPIPKSSKCINNLNLYFSVMCKVLGYKELAGPSQQKLEKYVKTKIKTKTFPRILKTNPINSKKYKQSTINFPCKRFSEKKK